MNRIILYILLSVLSFATAMSQTHTLDTYVLGSSVANATSSTHSVKSTAGQPAIGLRTSNTNSAQFGFWYQIGSNPFIDLDISLTTGWNMISSYVMPKELLMDSVFNDILGNILIVKNGDGKIFVPSFSINTIGNWNIHDGYQVYSTVNQTLTITGLPVNPLNESIYTNVGWNLLGYLWNSALSPVTALATVTEYDNLLIAKNGAGKIFVPSFGINTIGLMIPGDGYQMYTVNLDTLIYPANGIPKQTNFKITPRPVELIPIDSKTGNDMTLIVRNDFETGTEIGVYDERDILIGSGVVDDGVAGITIWGDDEYTDEIDGAKTNSKLSVKALQNSELKELNIKLENIADNTTINELRYQKGAVLTGSINTLEVSESISVNPQPAIDEIELTMNNIEGIKEIEIRDLEGKSLFKTTTESNELKIDVRELVNATYFVIVKSGNNTYSKKFMKIN